LVHAVARERQVRRAHWAPLEKSAYLERQDFVDRLERLAVKATTDVLEPLDLLVCLDLVELEASRERMGPRVCLVLTDPQDNRDRKVLQEIRVEKDLEVRVGLLVNVDPRVPLAQWDLAVQRASRVHQGRKEPADR